MNCVKKEKILLTKKSCCQFSIYRQNLELKKKFQVSVIVRSIAEVSTPMTEVSTCKISCESFFVFFFLIENLVPPVVFMSKFMNIIYEYF